MHILTALKKIGRYYICIAISILPLLATQAHAQKHQLNPERQCYTNTEISAKSTTKGIVIAGTLTLPLAQGAHPAVLMITGNGPHTRDQMISKSPMFGMLADHFAKRGIAVLRTDARGYGASTGPNDWELYTTADRITDNRAVLALLRQNPKVDSTRIILFGHSEGAMIAAALAATGADPALSVLLAPSSLPGAEVFARQRSDALQRKGATTEIAQAVHKQLLRFAEFLVNDRDNREKFEAIALDFLAAHGVSEDQFDPKFAQSLLEGFLKAPWYWHFLDYDPRDHLRQVQSPVLAIFAGADKNVPWQLHLPALTAAFSKGRISDLTTIVLPDQDHFFFEFDGIRLEKHKPGEMKIADELLAALDAEFERRGLIGRRCDDAYGE